MKFKIYFSHSKPGAIYVHSSRRETCETGQHEQSYELDPGKTTETKAPTGKIHARQRKEWA